MNRETTPAKRLISTVHSRNLVVLKSFKDHEDDHVPLRSLFNHPGWKELRAREAENTFELSPAESADLAGKYRETGESHYFDDLVQGNQPVVLRALESNILSEQEKHECEENVLYVAGLMGLIDAADLYQEEGVGDFQEFSLPFINQAIHEHAGAKVNRKKSSWYELVKARLFGSRSHMN